MANELELKYGCNPNQKLWSAEPHNATPLNLPDVV